MLWIWRGETFTVLFSGIFTDSCIGLYRKVKIYLTDIVLVFCQIRLYQICLFSFDSYHLTIFDCANKFVAFSSTILSTEPIKVAAGEWGCLFLLTSDGSFWQLKERDLQSKMTVFYKKNHYDLAIKVSLLRIKIYIIVAQTLSHQTIKTMKWCFAYSYCMTLTETFDLNIIHSLTVPDHCLHILKLEN